jgi:PAS domain S-box-containing protein
MPADRSLLLTSFVLQGAIALTFGLAFLGLWRGFRRPAAIRFAVAWLLYGGGTLAAALANVAGVADPLVRLGLLGFPLMSGVIFFSAGTDALALGAEAPRVRSYVFVCLALLVALPATALSAGPWLDANAPTFLSFIAPRLVMMAAYARAAWPLRRFPWTRWREGYALLVIALGLLSIRAGGSALYEVWQVTRGNPQTPESLLLTVIQLALLITFGVAASVVLIELERAEAVRSADTIRQTADALRASEARFRFVVEHSSDVQILVGLDRSIRYVSPSCERLAGVPPREIEGRDLLDLVHPDDRAIALEAFTRLVAGPTRRRQPVAVRIQHRMGHWMMFDVSGDGVAGPAGDPSVILSARDVTDQRRLEEEVLRRRRLDSLGQMAGGLAHDFGNMLTSIVGALEYAREHVARESPATTFLDVIADSSRRGIALTRQLLSFARQAPQSRVRFCVRERVGSLEGMLGVVTGRSIELKVEGEPGPLPVVADPNQFDQVLVNLAANARDAMPAGGRLTIRTALVPPGRQAGSPLRVRVVVEDTGTGIPPEVIDRIFEPFFTTKDEGQGTGLGLASAYGFARQAGGAISVESTPGAGARFTLDLPLDAD